MGHNTAIRAILCRVRVRVGRVNIEYNPVGAGVTATVDIVPVQYGELIQLLTRACAGELELTVIAEFVGEAAWDQSKRALVVNGIRSLDKKDTYPVGAQ